MAVCFPHRCFFGACIIIIIIMIIIIIIISSSSSNRTERGVAQSHGAWRHTKTCSVNESAATMNAAPLLVGRPAEDSVVVSSTTTTSVPVVASVVAGVVRRSGVFVTAGTVVGVGSHSPHDEQSQPQVASISAHVTDCCNSNLHTSHVAPSPYSSGGTVTLLFGTPIGPTVVRNPSGGWHTLSTSHSGTGTTSAPHEHPRQSQSKLASRLVHEKEKLWTSARARARTHTHTTHIHTPPVHQATALWYTFSPNMCPYKPKQSPTNKEIRSHQRRADCPTKTEHAQPTKNTALAYAHVHARPHTQPSSNDPPARPHSRTCHRGRRTTFPGTCPRMTRTRTPSNHSQCTGPQGPRMTEAVLDCQRKARSRRCSRSSRTTHSTARPCCTVVSPPLR